MPIYYSTMSSGIKKMAISISLILFSISMGILGFMFIEGFGLLDSFYMTVITLSTVGYKVIRPLSDSGKLFVSLYILFNVGIFAYIVAYIASYVFEGELRNEFNKYFNSKEIMKLKNHVIICGYGRNGQRACEELIKQATPFVVIEQDKEIIGEKIDIDTIPVVLGDASHEEILEKANIKNATHVISTLPEDAQNVFIALTSKELNPKITVISRLSSQHAEKKLRKAGVDQVVMPDTLGGRHMAQLITKPYIIKFINMLDGIEGGFELEEFYYEQFKNEYKDLPIKELHVRKQTGANLMAVGKREGGLQINPAPDTVLKKNWYYIVVGRKQSINLFKEEYILT